MFVRYEHLAQSPAETRTEGAVAILPLAAVESHGPHLPLGTDALIVEGILDRAAARDHSPAPTLRLPMLWLGASAEHADRAGTLSTEPEALIAQIMAIGDGLADAGLRRLVLFNGHGGNIAAGSLAALKLRKRHRLLAATIHWLDFGMPPALVPPAPVKGDVHGGWIETSVMLHLAPQLVGKERKPQAGAPPTASLFPTGPLQWGWTTGDLAAGGWIGRPEVATADLGRALVDHAAERLIAAVDDLGKAPWRPSR